MRRRTLGHVVDGGFHGAGQGDTVECLLHDGDSESSLAVLRLRALNMSCARPGTNRQEVATASDLLTMGD
jgi:hypothetical protein